ncbi:MULTISPECIES: hypothetical protein [unclassified Nocardioides]|uniref:hypothetical protein n=1 Tax=unclassified Nocardioides TaxID=2615069 RepID=UPI0006F6A06F|nr:MULTISPECIES: hypothetical protein [unclassified Nocardioides]KRA38311.1 hypothetical protein ASD81_06635 [Nocardioides sp. Root614]KRA92270.1 hypothetical protein ASD84_06900 [Nocardioides sp. Root682]
MTVSRSNAASPSDAQPEGGPSYVSNADLTASFDAFYRDARDRLLLQTFALTGDLSVARSAVREAYVVAWHHWRKTSRLPDPEMSVRPAAWRKALRRSNTRPLRRRKDLDEQSRKILDALAALSLVQRKALLLTQLAAVSMDEMAHEIGLPLEAAERELQLGAAQLATQLDIPTSAIPLSFNSLGPATRSVAWPRVTIIRRAGIARRRAHTIVGSATAVVALVAGGAVAMDSTGARPTLHREDVPVVTATPPSGPAVNTLPDTALIQLTTVQDALPGRGWQQGGTVDNSTGNGRVLPCQPDRYADPQGTAAWVRAFRNAAPATATRTVIQFAEASAAEPRAIRTYRRTLRWLTACPTPADDPSAVPRIQLISTADLPGVGDQASLVVLRSRANRTTYVVGVARSGLFTTTTSVATTTATAGVRREGVAGLLVAAVNRLCALADGGACAAAKPKVVTRAPYAVGKVPWMLSEVDLPPLSKDQGPWVGTPATALTEDRVDSGAIGCTTAHLFGSFNKTKIQGNQFRTFVLSESKLPPEVGLTQTVGSLPVTTARAFVRRIRDQIAACPDLDKSAGTEVQVLANSSTGKAALTAWRLSTALPGDRSVEYDVAVVRSGTSVSLLVFVAAPRARIAQDDFVALARRTLERLAAMAPYKAG